MPRSKEQREPIFVSIETFWCADENGNPFLVKDGMRLRGDIPRRFSQYFTPEDADDIERNQARAAATPGY